MRAVAAAVVNLERHVDEVDALNVFPVPDGDTGSNMLATMRAALAEAERLPEARRDLHSVAQALSRGALTGARGNSGVILSQIIRGMTLGADGRRRASGVDLATGLRHASDVAYGSVLTPIEGTILTVIRDTADAAEAAADRQPHVEEVLAVAIEAAARSVARTPSLLPVLEDAGVVDSGGQGLYRLLEGTFQLGAGSGNGARQGSLQSGRLLPGPASAKGDAPTRGASYGYETTYLLESSGTPIDPEALRRELDAVGESVVVAGDAAAVRVHVHGRRPDLALGVGLRAGRIGDVGIQDMDAQVEHHAGDLVAARPVAGLAMVAMAVTGAQAVAFSSVGVARVVRPMPGQRASAGEIAEAIAASGAQQVIVLPEDVDTHAAARLASSLVPSVAVSVLEVRNVAEGLVAALAFDAGVPAEQNVERMSGEARGLRTFSLATAVRDAVIDGRAVRQGQVIALERGSRLLAQADDRSAACLAALAQLEADGIELVTIYQGEEVADADVARLVGRLAAERPGIEVEVVREGQRGDSCLVAVE